MMNVILFRKQFKRINISLYHNMIYWYLAITNLHLFYVFYKYFIVNLSKFER